MRQPRSTPSNGCGSMPSINSKSALILLPAVLACGDAHVGIQSRDARAEPVLTAAQKQADSLKADSVRRAQVVRVPRPEVVRGLYVNRWAAVGKKLGQLIDIAKTTEVNALVIDVKDDRGFVLYKSRVPLAHEIGADTTRPMSKDRLRTILDTLVAQ